MAATGLPPATDTDVARVTEALSMITPSWNVRILLALSDGPLRYSQIADRLSWIHPGQLHPKVRLLCHAGLAERTEHASRHVTYGLTERGRQLLPALPALASWAGEFLEQPDTPLSPVEQIEDSLALISRRQTPAILWALKAREEATARGLARLAMPTVLWTGIYPQLRQLVDDGLVNSAGMGQPYRLTHAGHRLGGFFAGLSAWAAGRPPAHAATHPVWGNPDRVTPAPSPTWLRTPTRRPAPTTAPPPPQSTYRPAWRNAALFSHTHAARPHAALPMGAPSR
ncbi:helix-turn-helix domain-containing protein [Streptomyces sp. SCSIO 30461]|uniref:winged helix-turn-helix transcriptional regulator n=1 Tax=Streptomyces sp. SCSIO 30461 TaxID=3118085 RepID=UPI0030CD8407